MKEYRFKLDKEEVIKNIEEIIKVASNLKDIDKIEDFLKQIVNNIRELFVSKETFDELQALATYQVNEYSKDNTIRNILEARNKVINYLKDIVDDIQYNKEEKLNDEITENMAVIIIQRILKNFYEHIDVMYNSKPHGKAGITKEKLDNIKIVNEYDVQRILYSLIKPIFPEARVEVFDDTGCATIRYDIFIERYSIVIEVKCSRKSMSERSLTEEIGADIYHYKYNNMFFFVYDKEKIISNKVVFEKAYTNQIESKDIKTIVIQPINL